MIGEKEREREREREIICKGKQRARDRGGTEKNDRQFGENE